MACGSPRCSKVPSALEQRGAELVDEASSWDVLWADDRVDEVGEGAVRAWGSDFGTASSVAASTSGQLRSVPQGARKDVRGRRSQNASTSPP